MSTSGPALHALLIGVSYYQPDPVATPLPAPPSLQGAVRDVALVEAFLTTRLGVPASRIRTLTSTAPASGRGAPVEPPGDRPNYANMVAAFRDLGRNAAAGDLVYVHVSSHGVRAATRWPAHKAPDRWDEAIVPYDIADPAAQYLRDLEISHLLRELVKAGLVVTVVFDLCHSGEATRGVGDRAEGVVARSAPDDTTPRPPSALVASDADLVASATAARSATRSLATAVGVTPGDDYVLLAACRAHESAYECPFDGGGKNGALTYWTMDAVRGRLDGLSYRDVYARVLAKVHTRFDRQTPVLLGPADRAFLGTDRIPPRPPAVRVMSVDAAAGRVTLQTGQAVGVRKGTRFALYPQKAAPASAAPSATVEVDQLGAAVSGARVVDGGLAGVTAGDQAVLVGAATLRRTVRVAGDGTELDAVRREIAGAGAGWLAEAAAGKPADFHVAVRDTAGKRVFVVGDAADLPLPGLPAVPAAAAARLVGLLIHLARFRAVQEIENHNADSALAGALKVELLGRQADYDPADRPQPQPFPAGEVPELRAGEWVFIRVSNVSARPLNVCALDLQPDWGVSLVLPGSGDLSHVTLDPGGRRDLPLRAGLPDGLGGGTDVIKVFGSVGPADYRTLTLPAIDTGGRAGVTRSAGERAASRGAPTATGLDRLFAALTADRPATRTLSPANSPSDEWTAVAVTIRTVRPAPAP